MTANRPLSLIPPAYYLWGSNTGVGKTLISAGLAAACTRAAQSLLYLKPVQTGFPTDSDARLVAAAATNTTTNTTNSNTFPIPHFLGPHAAVLDPTYTPPPTNHHSSNQSQSQAWTLYAWSPPVSPHLAVAQHGRPVSDSTILTSLSHHINSNTHAFSLIETAGGVASPAPSGRLQCDVLRPLRLPGVLVGDGRLGGISSTISSWEALHRRGYDVPFIVIAEDEKRALGNSGVIRGAVVGRGVADVVELPPLPPLPHMDSTSSSSSSTTTTTTTTTANHNHINNIIDPMLQEWLEESSSQFDSLLINMKKWHTERLATLSSSPSRAEKMLWWPFTQHGSINSNNKTMIIDGRAGESFLTISSNIRMEKDSGSNIGNISPSLSTKDMEMVPLYDGCASWWTQGVGSHQQQDIADAISHAAARYGHVMFPENTHQPALNVAEKLLSTVGDGWADRVFYSDNGSTAIEVAIKMAFRKYMMDHNILDSREAEGGRGGGTSSPPPSLDIIGVQEAYHGDTLGAMDAVAPSVFNGRRQTPWYTGRGLFLPAKLFDGSDSNRSGTNTDIERDALASYFNEKMDEYESITPNHRLGALILEPVMQGAGGMRVIDPIWQSSLVKVCKQRKIPVIYDEVFTGLFRLGWKSAGPAVLDMAPDIACYAKLLTGGMVPLAVTLASADVFNCFLGSTKIQALLHGHSYTAHAIGCAAAEYSLDIFFSKIKGGERLGALWDVDQAQHIAEKLGGVERVTALGTVLVFDFGDAGSDRARAFALLLKHYAGIYTRPLGGVTYLMVTPLTTKEECRQLLNRVEGAAVKGGYGSGNREEENKMCVIHDGQFM